MSVSSAATAARRRGERGVTLVSLLVGVTIAGLIIGPVATMFVQAIRIVPQSGRRTQWATGVDRLATTLGDDVAQATRVSVGAPPDAATGAQPASTVVFDFPLAAAAPASSALAVRPTPCVRVASETQLVEAASWDVAAAATTTWTRTYRLRFAPAAPETMKVEVWRLRRTDPSITAEDSVFLTGYCGFGDTQVASVSAAAASATAPARVTLTLQLRPAPGDPMQPTTIATTVRAG